MKVIDCRIIELPRIADPRGNRRSFHRVLKTAAPLVFSLPHPVYETIDDDSEEPLLIRRSYFDRASIEH